MNAKQSFLTIEDLHGTRRSVQHKHFDTHVLV